MANEIAVADLSAVARSAKADVAQLAEHVLGKDEVTGSSPVIGSSLRSEGARASFCWQPAREFARQGSFGWWVRHPVGSLGAKFG